MVRVTRMNRFRTEGVRRRAGIERELMGKVDQLVC